MMTVSMFIENVLILGFVLGCTCSSVSEWKRMPFNVGKTDFKELSDPINLDDNFSPFRCAAAVTDKLKYKDDGPNKQPFVSPNAFTYDSENKTCQPGVMWPYSDDYQLEKARKEDTSGSRSYYVLNCAPKFEDTMKVEIENGMSAFIIFDHYLKSKLPLQVWNKGRKRTSISPTVRNHTAVDSKLKVNHFAIDFYNVVGNTGLFFRGSQVYEYNLPATHHIEISETRKFMVLFWCKEDDIYQHQEVMILKANNGDHIRYYTRQSKRYSNLQMEFKKGNKTWNTGNRRAINLNAYTHMGSGFWFKDSSEIKAIITRDKSLLYQISTSPFFPAMKISQIIVGNNDKDPAKSLSSVMNMGIRQIEMHMSDDTTAGDEWFTDMAIKRYDKVKTEYKIKC